jgi:NAD(P)-dependent dehydrogenase (short-subunit alcohol dehydrogenase family)
MTAQPGGWTVKDLDGQVAVVTGAGGGLGREHALLLAESGARVVVNDIGGSVAGDGSSAGPADDTAAEIRRRGGEAVADNSDISTWPGCQQLVSRAIDAYGDLNIVVNNAGIVRDRSLLGMSPDQWEHVLRVHLTGHFAMMQAAGRYWRSRAESRPGANAAVINTSSISGTTAVYPGQANYGAAKAGILALTRSGAAELSKYGVRVNAVVPAARTRITETVPGIAQRVRAPQSAAAFDRWHPGNVSPLVVVLADPACGYSGGVFYISGGRVGILHGWHSAGWADQDSRWTVTELRDKLTALYQDDHSVPLFES